MGVSQKAKDAYSILKKIKKAKDYYSAIQKTLDEDTRSEGLFKLGIKGLMDLSNKLVPGIKRHPFMKGSSHPFSPHRSDRMRTCTPVANQNGWSK